MKKAIFLIIAGLAFTASILMYVVGKNSDALSELYDTFWSPLPLGVICLLIALTVKKKAE